MVEDEVSKTPRSAKVCGDDPVKCYCSNPRKTNRIPEWELKIIVEAVFNEMAVPERTLKLLTWNLDGSEIHLKWVMR